MEELSNNNTNNNRMTPPPLKGGFSSTINNNIPNNNWLSPNRIYQPNSNWLSPNRIPQPNSNWLANNRIPYPNWWGRLWNNWDNWNKNVISEEKLKSFNESIWQNTDNEDINNWNNIKKPYSNTISNNNPNVNTSTNTNNTSISNDNITIDWKYKIAFILFIIVTSVIWKDIFILFSNLYDSTIWIFTNSNIWVSKNWINSIINNIVAILIVFFMFLPEVINNKFKNPLFIFSYNIIDKAHLIFKNTESPNFFVENKDNFIKIIYYCLLLIVTVIVYHFTIYKSFLEDTSILKTLSYMFMLITIISFTDILTLFINKFNNIELTNERKKISKVMYLILLYTIWSIIILYLWEELAKQIYEYISNIGIINKIL